MAQKNKRRNTAYRKEANTEFHTGAHNAFTGGGNAAYQPRDSGIGKPGHGLGGKRQTEKSIQDVRICSTRDIRELWQATRRSMPV